MARKDSRPEVSRRKFLAGVAVAGASATAAKAATPGTTAADVKRLPAAVEPMAHPLPVNNVFRADEVHPSIGTEAALAVAPKRDESFYLVPPVLD